MKSTYYESHEWEVYKKTVKDRASGSWDVVLQRLAPALGPALERAPKHVACPRHSGVNGDGFRLYTDYRVTGGSVCNTCGPRHDGFATLMWINDWRYAETVRYVGDMLGVTEPKRPGGFQARPAGEVVPLPPPPPVKSQEEIAADDERRARRLAEMWDQSIDLVHPQALPLRKYLLGRDITPVYGPLEDLRFHPKLGYYEHGQRETTYPALLSLLRCATGEACTIHRTYLTEEGRKAPMDDNRKLMPRRTTKALHGAAVRLDHAVKSVLCVGEGLETCLAWRVMTGLPTWAGTTANIAEHIEVPDSVKVVVVLADKDRSNTGQEMAARLVARLQGEGRHAVSYPPPFAIPEGNLKGIDWADVLAAYGAEEARKLPAIFDLLGGVRQKLLDLGLEWEEAACQTP